MAVEKRDESTQGEMKLRKMELKDTFQSPSPPQPQINVNAVNNYRSVPLPQKWGGVGQRSERGGRGGGTKGLTEPKGDLLSSIQSGMRLKRAPEKEKKGSLHVEDERKSNLSSALAASLSARRVADTVDTLNYDSEDEDEEWEDGGPPVVHKDSKPPSNQNNNNNNNNNIIAAGPSSNEGDVNVMRDVIKTQKANGSFTLDTLVSYRVEKIELNEFSETVYEKCDTRNGAEICRKERICGCIDHSNCGYLFRKKIWE